MNSLEVSSVKNDNGEKCITSLAIAEMTGKDHSKVIRDIKAMLEGLGLDEARFGSVYLGGNNQERPMFILPEREALTLASGYDVKLRVKVVDFFLNGHKPMSELDMVITIATELKGVKEVQEAIRTSQELLGNEILSIKEERKKDADFRQEVLNQRHVGIMDNPPPPGYKGMPSIEKLSRLTKPIIEHIISRLNNIGTSQCYMYIDNANGFRDYTAYHHDTYRRAEAVFISECNAETKTLYSHHTYKKGRFQIAQEN